MQDREISAKVDERLRLFSAMVERWNGTINLVSPTSLPELRERHIADSLQLMSYAPSSVGRWVDLGSGGGFPGLVIAAALSEQQPLCKVTLIESDQRKATFLRQAARAMDLACEVLAQRIEQARPQAADVLSARALAPLRHLVALAQRHAHPGSTFIFPKGSRVEDEISEAQQDGWKFDHDLRKSRTDPSGRILILRNVTRDFTP
jgi:16S rRNA (guanine527-N7)-methyltransferase